ncbi:MAG: mechanosensitive ion channel [Novosphingobium sp.]|nr:mechanosensitive ion channel [Novosphingobium sp.]
MTFADHLERIGVTLSKIGFDVGKYRISVYSGLSTIVVVIAVIVIARLGGKLARRFFKRLNRLDSAQQELGEKLLSLGIWLFAILVGVDALGIDLTALAVFSGAFGLAVGFGLQKTFGNLIAGIILLMDRSIKPGDVIAVNDGTKHTVGQVKHIGLRAVSVTTRDKKEYLIPNENLMINQVENWSYSSRDVRVRVPLVISPNTDLDLAESLMLQAARGAVRVLAEPAPTAWVTELSGIGIAYEIRIWINDPEEGLGNVRADVLKRAWKLFQEHGITLPNTNQREVGLRDLAALREMVEGLRGR